MIITAFPVINVFAAHEPYLGIKIPDYDEATTTIAYDARGFIKNLRGSNYVGFKDVDFGENGTNAVDIVVGAGAGSEGIIGLYIDDPNSQPIAQFETYDGGWLPPYTLTADITAEVKGVHNIYLKNITGVCNMYTLLFYEKPEVAAGVVYKSEDHFEDIAESSYRNEINMFYEMGILNGFNEKEYEPQLYMNRGDFATVIYRLLGTDAIGEIPFADVPPDNPNYVAVSWMYGAGLITGDGNSLYRPYDFITIQEAATIAVRTLGFEEAAQKGGGFPNGYMTVAKKEGLLDGINVNNFIRRDEIAGFLYNFVHADYLDVETITDAGVVYSRKSGVMESFKDIYIGSGTVTATGSTALKVLDSGLDSKSVMIDDEVYDVGDTAAAGLLGYEVDFYYREEGGKKILTNVRPNPSLKITKVSSDKDQIVSINEDEAEYYDENGKLCKITFGSNTAFVYNGKAADKPLDKLLMAGDFIGRITYIDNGDNDVVNIEQHKTVIVGSIDTVDKIVYDKLDPSEKYSFNPANSDSAIYLDSEPFAFGQLKGGAVLSLFQSGNDSGKKSNIAFLEQNFVSGTISAITDDIVTIDGAEYKHAMVDGTAIEVGLSGTFCVNYLGMLVSYEDEGASDDIKPGMILDYNFTNDGFDKKCELKIFTSENKEEIFTCANKVYADGVAVTEADKILSGSGAFRGLNNLEKITLIRYRLNADGKISMFDTYMPGEGGKNDKLTRLSDDTLYRVNKNTHSFLSSVSGELGKAAFLYDESPETFFFSTGQTDPERLTYVANMMDLVGGDFSATGDIYTISDPADKMADYFVWNNRAASHTQLYDSPFVVSEISTIVDDDGDEGYIIEGYTSISDVEYTFTNDFLSKNEDIADAVTALRNGDVVLFTIDYAGNIIAAEIIYLRDGADSVNGINPSVNDNSQINDFKSPYQYRRAVVGTISSIKDNVITLDCVVNGTTTQEMLFIDGVDLIAYGAERDKVFYGMPLSNLIVGNKVLVCINEKVTSLVLRYEN